MLVAIWWRWVVPVLVMVLVMVIVMVVIVLTVEVMTGVGRVLGTIGINLTGHQIYCKTFSNLLFI